MAEVLAALILARFCWLRKAGIAIADNTPMMITTISSSIRVKPAALPLRLLPLVLRLWIRARWACNLVCSEVVMGLKEPGECNKFLF